MTNYVRIIGLIEIGYLIKLIISKFYGKFSQIYTAKSLYESGDILSIIFFLCFLISAIFVLLYITE